MEDKVGVRKEKLEMSDDLSKISSFSDEMRDYLDKILDDMDKKGHSIDGICKSCGKPDLTNQLMRRYAERKSVEMGN